MADTRTESAGRACGDLARWYTGRLGALLAGTERAALDRVLADLFGYYLVQIGDVGSDLTAASRIGHRFVLDRPVRQGVSLAALPEVLPFASDSVDVIVLVHALEFAGDPHQVLREAYRCLIPEGHLVVLGFNPWSLWGVRHLLQRRHGQLPWCGRFLSQARIKDWLGLLDFDLVSMQGFFFRPPLEVDGVMQRLRVLERGGERGWPIPAGCYLALARKRVATLTPIRPKWRPRREFVSAGLAEPTIRSVPRARCR